MGGGEGFPFGCNPRLQFQVRFRRSVYKHHDHAEHDARISSATAAAEEEEEEALGMEPMSRRSSVDSTRSPAIMSAPLPPKIPSFTLPARPDPPGMATPPIHLPGSVPFRWEDAPGKPKRSAAAAGGARLSTVLIQSRILDLPVPPRLQGGSATSPADVTYHLCSAASEMRKSRSFREAGERAGWSWRRGRRGRREVDGSSPWTSGSATSASTGVYSATSTSAASSCSDGCKSIHDVGWRFDCRIGCWFKGEDGEKPRARVKISAAMTRSRSASDLLPSGRPAPPHWLGSIYGALKQVVLRRKECKEE